MLGLVLDAKHSLIASILSVLPILISLYPAFGSICSTSSICSGYSVIGYCAGLIVCIDCNSCSDYTRLMGYNDQCYSIVKRARDPLYNAKRPSDNRNIPYITTNGKECFPDGEQKTS